ncbi:hypothetical protein NP493_189g02018 [Ridgeia piscesae]|uniref:Uncharacterized protein n=1 Tax=Ridgeia piscesae TaxID=27915 RepID=A0AAD9P2E7_RIDPI|nr:hypothetical protein NP493_189g02018 [Ridgeia piscesae]
MELQAGNRNLTGSFNNLTVIYDDGEDREDQPRFKEKKGLLRRAFSSRKKKKKRGGLTPSPQRSPGPPSPLPACNLLSPTTVHGKQPVRIARSNPLTFFGDG